MVVFHTAMREAFARVGILPSNPRVGLVHMGKGWNASLSFKTAQALKAQGIL